MTIILNGKKLANKIKLQLEEEIKEFETKPGLAIIIVGNNYDSKLYVRMKHKACLKCGISSVNIHLDNNVNETDIIEQIEMLNEEPSIHGILVQLPLPKDINTRRVLNKISLEKDVDSFNSHNVGNLCLNLDYLSNSPCTPLGCIRIFDEYNIELQGKNIVIIGRSNIVGLPLSLLLLHRNATVTICHSKTKDIFKHTQHADILIVAIGKAHFIKKEHIKDGAIIIDIGINKLNDNTKKRGYRLVGDVDYEDVSQKASAITPVPGGIGPLTIAMLLTKTIELYKNHECTKNDTEELGSFMVKGEQLGSTGQTLP